MLSSSSLSSSFSSSSSSSALSQRFRGMSRVQSSMVIVIFLLSFVAIISLWEEVSITSIIRSEPVIPTHEHGTHDTIDDKPETEIERPDTGTPNEAEEVNKDDDDTRTDTASSPTAPPSQSQSHSRWGPRRTSALDWSTVPPFPTHTRNVTRQLEWIDRYDTSPLHEPHSHPGIIITFVNMGFIDMTLNWLCHIRALQIDSYLVIAMDVDVFHAMLAWDPHIHVYLWQKEINLMDPATITDPDPNTTTAPVTTTSSSGNHATLVYNDPVFVDMMVRRLRFTIDMLRLWPHPLIFVDTDIVLFHDILPEFTSGPESRNGDVIAQADDSSVMCAGQILFRPTENVILLLEDVLKSTIDKKFANEQDALNHGFLNPNDSPYHAGNARAVNRVMLSTTQFPSGLEMWGRLGDLRNVPNTLKRISEQGWMPSSVHNNWILKKDVKIKRFQDYGMWQADDIEKGTCAFDSYYNIHMPPKPRLNIHILAYKRVDSLKRLLTSLANSHYDDRQINVTLHVDVPADTNDIITLGHVRAVVKLFRDEWEWKYGHKFAKQRDVHVGQNRQYYDLWEPPTTNDEVIIVLQDDEIMSPYWYTWLRKAVDTYYGTDPFMYGISLQRQYFVPGAYGTGPNPPVSASHRSSTQTSGVRWKRDNAPLLYQQLGTWGQLFFPAHYRLFLEYVRIHRVHAEQHSSLNDIDPSIGNLETNSWFHTEKGRATANGKQLQFDDINWEYWFMAMTAEYGLYTMYTDFANEKALLINNQEAGDHYVADAGPDAKIMNDDSWKVDQHMQFPDISQQPVYDFWMKPIEARPALSIRRMLLHKYWQQVGTTRLPSLPKLT